MSAPTLSSRGTPTGIPLHDGFSTKISFNSNTTVSFWEKDVQPPGYDGGEKVDQTTMHNIQFKTSVPRTLIDVTGVKTKVAYDPNVYNSGQILSLINRNDSITVHFPEGSTLTFFGFLQKFTPASVAEGEQPVADIEIMPTNYDDVAHTEQAPVLVSVSGS